MVTASEKFLAKHLGGRYQESATPEVAKRLGEITVDPKTVVLAKPVDMTAAVGANISGKWSMTVDAGGQTVDISLDLKQEGADFTGSTSSHLGDGTVEKGKVSGTNVKAIVKSDVQGQMMEIQLDGKVDGDKMTGTLVVPGLGTMPFTAVKPK